MTQILLITFLSWLPLVQDYTKLEKVKIQDAKNTFIFKIPEYFIPMSDSDIQAKYQSYRKSIAQYTSQDRLTDFGINRAFSRFQSDDIELMSQFYKASLNQLYTEVKFIKEEIQEINGRKFAIFEFESFVSDEGKSFGTSKVISKYVYIQYTLVDENTVVCNFQAPLVQREEWEDVAEEMMNSIVIK